MASAQTLSLLCWNVYHGRDAPPNRALFTKRSRWRRVVEDDGTYVQVNRRLFGEYTELIAQRDWSVCALQEFPPSWTRPLTERCNAAAHRVLTSRNQLRHLTGLLARWNPDLLGANEGGSNITLVRDPWQIQERRSLLLNPLPERGLGERRRMGFVRLVCGHQEVCVANLHASVNELMAETQIMRAAERATEWSASKPLAVCGDFNVRPRSSRLYEQLEDKFGLRSPTGPDAIDHMLVRGLEPVERPRQLPTAERELIVEHDGEPRRLRLSDHAPVVATFTVAMR